MKALKSRKIDSEGFTLVEVIVTIVAAGILGAIFINFMGTALQSSWNAVEIAHDEANTERVLERIVGEYVVLINGNNPAGALDIIDDYHGTTTIEGVSITAQYVTFDSSGNEQTGGTDYLKIVLQVSGPAAPAISGRFPLTTILANNRETDEHFVLF